LTDIGLMILATVTVKIVPEDTPVETILVIKITVLRVTLQTAPELVVADLVTVAVHPPLAMERSEGNVIFTAEPDNNGFMIVNVKVYVVVAETRVEAGDIVHVEKMFGTTVIVFIAFA
jgi:membrane-bound ClpP family serine protease